MTITTGAAAFREFYVFWNELNSYGNYTEADRTLALGAWLECQKKVNAAQASEAEIKKRLQESATRNLGLRQRVLAAEARVKELEDQKPIAWTDGAGMELLGMEARDGDVSVWRHRTGSKRFPLYARIQKDGE